MPKLDQLPLELVKEIADSISSVDNDAISAQRTMCSLSRVNMTFAQTLTTNLCKHNAEKRGGSAFERVIKRRRWDIIGHLLRYGADITSQESGYPLFLALEQGSVDIFEYIWLSAQGSFLPVAILQPVDNDQNTLLHWAIRRALVPCVNRLLRAGANISVLNLAGSRPIDYLFESPQRHHASHYAEIVRLLLDLDAAEMLKPLTDPNTAGVIGSTTPLIQAARGASLECVNALFEAAGADQDLDEYVNDFCTSRGGTALAAICDPRHWPCDETEGYRVVEIVKSLLIHGADANEFEADMEGVYGLPIYKSCRIPLSDNDARKPLLTIKLQHDVISTLIEYGADVKLMQPHNLICLNKFLRRAEYYSFQALDPSNISPAPEDILHTTHPTLISDPTFSGTWSPPLEPEEVEREEILRLLQGTFQKLLDEVDEKDFEKYRIRGVMTLLHRVAAIPGPFGAWATRALLDKGVSVYMLGEGVIPTKDNYERTPLKYAVRENMNRGSISILRHWARYLRRH